MHGQNRKKVQTDENDNKNNSLFVKYNRTS